MAWSFGLKVFQAVRFPDFPGLVWFEGPWRWVASLEARALRVALNWYLAKLQLRVVEVWHAHAER